MERKEKLAKLRKMLAQVAPADVLESPGAGLESTDLSEKDLGLIDRGMSRLMKNKKINAQEEFALEAIVLKRNRPVINIIGDKFSAPPSPWKHLGQSDHQSKLLKAIPSIGRIELPNHPKAPFGGTGFVVAPHLIMTNRHVAELFATGTGVRQLAFRPNLSAAVDFRREVIPTTPDLVSVKRVAMIHPYWDMALLEVDGTLDRTPLTLSTRHPDELREKEIAIIGYPARDSRNKDEELQNRIFGKVFNVKRLQPGKIKTRRDLRSFGKTVSAMTHDSSTLGGNSGSAVIDIASGDVVGLHFAGLYLDANFAVPTHELARDPRVVDTAIQFDGTVPSTSEWDSHWRHADSVETATSIRGEISTGTQAVANAHSSNPMTMNWTIPLHVSVSIGQPTMGDDSSPGVTPADAGSKPTADGASGNELLFRRKRKQLDDAAIQLSLQKFSRQSLRKDRFDWLTALSATVFSRMAYWERSQIRARVLSSYQFTHCEVFTPGSMQAIVAIEDDLVVVAFRGTANRRNWLINLNTFGTEAGNYGKVHGGFYHAFQSARPALEQYIDRHAASQQKLVLAGHSLGGALATIAAAEWHERYDLLSMYTVGQPAAGKRDFRGYVAQNFEDRFFRMVNEDDLVPMVPPGYKHVGKLLHFQPDGTVADSIHESIDDFDDTMSEKEFEAMQDRLRQELEAEQEDPATENIALEGIPNTTDHGTDRYLRKILTQLEASSAT
ncbi:MAG: trypsin-like peptidase domain-containing protein [Planctomycetota bacterium]